MAAAVEAVNADLAGPDGTEHLPDSLNLRK